MKNKLDMAFDVAPLLKEIDTKTSPLQEEFAKDFLHKKLNTFSDVLVSYKKLDDMIENPETFSEAEAKIIGHIYSTLAFRLIDTTSEKDESKLKEAEKIIARAEAVTLGTEKTVFKTKSYLYRKMEKYGDGKKRKIEIYKASLRALLLSDPLKLVSSYGHITKTGHKSYDSRNLSKRELKSGLRCLYEITRWGAFALGLITTAVGFKRGMYTTAAIGFGFCTGIPLSRYLYQKRKMDEILHAVSPGYKLPKLKETKTTERYRNNVAYQS